MEERKKIGIMVVLAIVLAGIGGAVMSQYMGTSRVEESATEQQPYYTMEEFFGQESRGMDDNFIEGEQALVVGEVTYNAWQTLNRPTFVERYHLYKVVFNDHYTLRFTYEEHPELQDIYIGDFVAVVLEYQGGHTWTAVSIETLTRVCMGVGE